MRVDQAVPTAERATASTAGPAITGRSGVTIAYWLSAHPGASLSPNRHSALLRLAPSTISTTVHRLAEAGLVDEAGAAVAPELFWELAAVWHTDRTWLVRRPDPKQYIPADPLAPSWRVTGTAAAAAYGAPLAAAGEGPLELYVTGPVELSIAMRRYGAAAPGAGAAVIAVPPTSLVNERHGGDVLPMIQKWPAAPLVAVALDLAQDESGGTRDPQCLERRAWHLALTSSSRAPRWSDWFRPSPASARVALTAMSSSGALPLPRVSDKRTV